MTVQLERKENSKSKKAIKNYYESLDGFEKEKTIYSSYNVELYANHGYGVQIHHLIPVSKAKDYRVLFESVFNESDYDINDFSNLIVLPDSPQAVNYAKDQGLNVSMHWGTSSQHNQYNDLVDELLEVIAFDLKSARAADPGDLESLKAANDFAARRIFNLQNTLRNALLSSGSDGKRLFLHYNDPALIDLYNNSGLGNNSPPWESLTEDAKKSVLKNYNQSIIDSINPEDMIGKVGKGFVQDIDIEGNRNKYYSSQIVSKKISEVFGGPRNNTSLENGSASIQLISLMLVGSSLVALAAPFIDDEKPLFDQTIDFIKNTDLDIDPEIIRDLAGDVAFEVAVELAVKTLGGPVALAWSAYEVYQSFNMLSSSLDLAVFAFPDSELLGDIQDVRNNIQDFLSNVEHFELDNGADLVGSVGYLQELILHISEGEVSLEDINELVDYMSASPNKGAESLLRNLEVQILGEDKGEITDESSFRERVLVLHQKANVPTSDVPTTSPYKLQLLFDKSEYELKSLLSNSSDISIAYSVINGLPFAIKGVNHKFEKGELELIYNNESYRNDRIEFYRYLMASGKGDSNHVPKFNERIYFKDEKLNKEVFVGSYSGTPALDENVRRVIFGDVSNNIIEAGEQVDKLYGGAGNDIYHFSAGDEFLDYDGNDSYIIDTSNLDGQIFLINDLDGKGTLIIDGEPIGLAVEDSEGTWRSGRFTLSFSNTSLLIFESQINIAEIANFKNGDLGITLQSVLDTTPESIEFQRTYIGDIDGPEADFIGGSYFNDQVLSGDLDDHVLTYGGDDSVKAGAGNDWVEGDAGDDQLHGEEGNDYLIGGLGTDTIFGGTGNDWITLDENAGNIGESEEFADGGEGDDWISGGGGSDVIAGGSGTNKLYGGSGSDVITSGDGDDTVAGDGYAIVSKSQGTITARLQTDYTDALGGFNDQIDAGNGDNVVIGGAGADLITTGTGNDQIHGDKDDISLYAGNHTTDFVILPEELHGNDIINSGAGNDEIIAGGGNDFVNAGDGDDAIWGDDSTNSTAGGNDIIHAGAGRDVVYGGKQNDRIYGGSQDDSLYGNEGSDFIYAGSENDVVHGNEGRDFLYGEEGNDTILGNEGDDLLVGGIGTDYLAGGKGNDTYTFNLGDAEILSGVLDNIVDNSGENNKVVFESGISQDDITLNSAGGDLIVRYHNEGFLITNGMTGAIDTFKFNNSGEEISYKELLEKHLTASNITFDTVSNSSGSEIDEGINLVGTAGNDRLSGGSGIDSLIGGDGSDQLLGGAENDYLFGGDGDDHLVGGEGNDQLVGGDGNDHYYFGFGSGIDVIDNRYHNLSSDNSDLLHLGAGIKPEQISVIKDGGDIFVHLKGTSDIVIVKDQSRLSIVFDDWTFWGPDYISTISNRFSEFSHTNGSIASSDSAFGKLVTNYAYVSPFYGDTRDNILIGRSNYHNILNGKEGADLMWGSVNGDTYYVDHESDIVIEADFNAPHIKPTQPYHYNGVDTIVSSIDVNLVEGIENLLLTSETAKYAKGNDMDNIIQSSSESVVLGGGQGDDTYIVKSSAVIRESEGEGIDTIVFMDGGTHSLENYTNIENAKAGANGSTIIGNDGNNILWSASANVADDWLRKGWNPAFTLMDDYLGYNSLNLTVLEGGLGDDTLIGGIGSDIYHYEMGDGSDTIVNVKKEFYLSGKDTLRFGNTVEYSNLTFQRDGDADILIGINDEQIRIQNQLVSSHQGIEWIDVAYGNKRVSLSRSNILELANGENISPFAEGEDLLVVEDTSLVLNISDLLSNDFDIDNDNLYIESIQDFQDGTAVLDLEAETITFTPNKNYSGMAMFTYTVADGSGGSSTVSVSLTVDPANDEPIVITDSFNTDEDVSLILNIEDLLSNDIDVDGDRLSITAVSNAVNGSVSMDSENGTVTFIPDSNYTGSASFYYTVNDGSGGSHTGSVNLNINETNDLPVTVTDIFSTVEDLSLELTANDLLSNDNDIDGDSLSITAVGNAVHGSVSINAQTGTITFIPKSDYAGSASFEYTASDGNGGSATGYVNLTVDPKNDVPVAVTDSFNLVKDNSLVINIDSLLSNDLDVDGDNLSISSISNVQNGTASIDNQNGTVTFVPNADYSGPASFDYTIDDSNGGYATTTVNIVIADTPPTSADNVVTGTESGEQLLGTNSKDLIQGLGGNDQIYGFAGNDQLEGGDGDDRLQGGNGSNSNSGDDILFGGAGNDILVGEDGDDRLEGGAGNDHYYYFAGSGKDVIIDAEDGQDILFFNDVAPARLSYHREGDDLIVLVDGDLNQQVRVKDHFLGGNHEIMVQPNGGYTQTAAAIANQLTALPGGDSSGSNPDGGDTDGNTGGDSSGDETPVSNPTLDLTGDDAISGSDQSEILVSGAGDDSLTGLGGNDRLIGGTGNDVYIIGTSNGQDTIIDSEGQNIIRFVDGIGFNDVASGLMKSGDDLILRISGSATNSVRISNFFSVANTIEKLEFEVGGQITAAQLYGAFGLASPTATLESGELVLGDGIANSLAGADGHDMLFGGRGGDSLQGNAGNDQMVGGAGDDVYLIGAGHGQDTIVDSQGSNVIRFIDGLSFNDVASGLMKSGDDLILRISGSSTNSVRIENFFGVANTIEKLEFETGGQITASQLYGAFGSAAPTSTTVTYDLLTDVITGGDGNDTLAGSDRNETLSGGIGNDTLDGGAGNDRYLFGQGDGQDHISQNDTSGHDVLAFTGNVTSDQLWFSQQGDDLQINIAGGNDKVIVDDWYTNAGAQVDEIEVGSSVLRNSQVAQLVSAMAAYSVPEGDGNVISQSTKDALQPVLTQVWESR